MYFLEPCQKLKKHTYILLNDYNIIYKSSGLVALLGVRINYSFRCHLKLFEFILTCNFLCNCSQYFIDNSRLFCNK